MRFMHLADVHLGAVPEGRTGWGESRKKEIWDTFRSTIADASREEVDLLLIAGDLFHRQPTEDELREVNYLFSTIPDTRIVLIAGNHDHLQPMSPYLSFQWNQNVICLFSRECECVRFPDIRTEVYGFSYDRREIAEPLYDGLRPVRDRMSAIHDGTCRILLAHGGDAKHIPIDRKALEKSRFDYIALGHIHKPEELLLDKAAYSGALEPIDRNDTGPHGYILGSWEHGSIEIEFVPKAKREYRDLELQVQESDTTYSLKDRVERLINENGWHHIYRISLCGKRDPLVHFDRNSLMEYGMVLEVTDQTVSSFPLEELKRRYRGQLPGRFIESFEDHELSETEEKALQYGLEALLKHGR